MRTHSHRHVGDGVEQMYEYVVQDKKNGKNITQTITFIFRVVQQLTDINGFGSPFLLVCF